MEYNLFFNKLLKLCNTLKTESCALCVLYRQLSSYFFKFITIMKPDFLNKKQTIQRPSLSQNSLWRMAGQIIYLACQWGILVALAKLGNPEMVGQFSLGLAISAPIILFFNFQLRIVQSTDIKNEYAFSEYFILRALSGLGAFFTTFLITWFLDYTNNMVLIVVGIALAKITESMSEVIHAFFQKHEQMKFVAYSLIIKGFFALIFLTIGIYISGVLIGGIIGMICAWTIALIFDMRKGAKMYNSIAIEKKRGLRFFLEPFLKLKTAKKLVMLTLPLGFVTMLSSFTSNVPRYFIGYYLGERELGLFSAVSYFMMFGVLMSSAFGETVAPRLAKYYAAKDNRSFLLLLRAVLTTGTIVWLLGLGVVAIMGEDILALIYSNEYSKYSEILFWVIFAAGLAFIASMIRYAIMATKFYKGQTPLFLSLAMITVLFCYIFIPKYGVMGACISLNLTMLSQIVGSTFMLYRVINSNLQLQEVTK